VDDWDDEMSNADGIVDVRRRLQRIEDRMDLRMIAPEVFEAYKATMAVTVTAIEHRLAAIERGQQTAVRMMAGTLIGIVVQAVVIALTLAGKGGPS
jgi:hypothetical protein